MSSTGEVAVVSNLNFQIHIDDRSHRITLNSRQFLSLPSIQRLLLRSEACALSSTHYTVKNRSSRGSRLVSYWWGGRFPISSTPTRTLRLRADRFHANSFNLKSRIVAFNTTPNVRNFMSNAMVATEIPIEGVYYPGSQHHHSPPLYTSFRRLTPFQLINPKTLHYESKSRTSSNYLAQSMRFATVLFFLSAFLLAFGSTHPSPSENLGGIPAMISRSLKVEAATPNKRGLGLTQRSYAIRSREGWNRKRGSGAGALNSNGALKTRRGREIKRLAKGH